VFCITVYVCADGVNSLLSAGVADEPLLQVAKEKADVLSYAHICRDFPHVEDSEKSDDDENTAVRCGFRSDTKKGKLVIVDNEFSDEYEFQDEEECSAASASSEEQVTDFDDAESSDEEAEFEDT